MNIKEARERVNRVLQSGTPYLAREAERSLWYAVLSDIAHGVTDDPAGIAMAAVKTIDVTTPENQTSVGEI